MRLLLIGLLALAATPGSSVVVRDVDGRSLTLLASAAGKTELLIFVNTECPISNRYAPEISRICGDYRARGVGCVLVYPDKTTTATAVTKHRQDFSLAPGAPAVIDRDLALTTAVDATVTPEAAIYTSSGLAYRGRIDDLYADVGQARRAATVHDVRAALDAIIAGKHVPMARTEPVGCTIERR